MTLPEHLIVFPGARIDGRRVRVEREPGTGQASGVGGFLAGPLPGAPEEAAYEFLHANQRLFKSTPQTLRELRVQHVSRSPAGYHVVFQQVHEGLPVEEAQASVHLTRDKRVHAARLRLSPQAAELDVQAMARDGINRDEAISIALQRVRVNRAQAEVLWAERVILAEKEAVIAWKVSLAIRERGAEWLLWVDARSGRVLRQRQVSIE